MKLPARWNHLDKVEFNKSGIYIIYYYGEKHIYTLYIGQSKNIKKRIQQHISDSNNIDKELPNLKDEKRNPLSVTKHISFLSFLKNYRKDIYVDIFPYPIEELNEEEDYLITKCKPLFNYQGIDVPYIPCKRSINSPVEVWEKPTKL